MNTLDQIKNNPVNRRAFLQRMGAAGLGVAAIALLDGCGGGSSDNNNGGGGNGGGGKGNFPVSAIPGRNTNEQVLNFALTLEILEADLYRQALNIASGKPVTAALTRPGDYTAAVGAGGINAGAAFAYLRDFAFVEAAHRDFLTTAIRSGGGTPVKRQPKGYKFPDGSGIGPGSNLKDLLTAIYPLEEEGVSAYLGAAPFLNDLGLLQTAVTIYSTEARHSAAIAYILGLDTGPARNVAGVGNRKSVVLGGSPLPPQGPNNESDKPNVFEYFISPNDVVNDIQALIVQ